MPYSRAKSGLTRPAAQPYNPRVPLQATSRARVAVFASGGGSNLQAILDYFTALGAQRAGDVVLVVSDRSDAPALNRARNAIGVQGEIDNFRPDSCAIAEGNPDAWRITCAHDRNRILLNR